MCFRNSIGQNGRGIILSKGRIPRVHTGQTLGVIVGTWWYSMPTPFENCEKWAVFPMAIVSSSVGLTIPPGSGSSSSPDSCYFASEMPFLAFIGGLPLEH